MLTSTALVLAILGSPTVKYLGIGSNVDPNVMRARIGSTPVRWEPALVREHRLAFTALGAGSEPAFASIEPTKGREIDECHGVLYTLTIGQLVRLCASEGVPFAYDLVSVPCETYSGRFTGACAFRAKGPGRIIEQLIDLRPSRRYLDLIREGARKSGLSPSWRERLDAIKSVSDPASPIATPAATPTGQLR